MAAGSNPTRTTESDVSQNTLVQVPTALDVEHWTRPHLRLTSFFALHLIEAIVDVPVIGVTLSKLKLYVP